MIARSRAQQIAIILAILNRGQEARRRILAGKPELSDVRVKGGQYYGANKRFNEAGRRIDREIRQQSSSEIAKENKIRPFGLTDVLKGFSFHDETYTTKLRVNTFGGPLIRVQGEIFDGSLQVGRFTRSIYLDEGRVHHDEFFLHPRVQGNGLATRLNSAADDFYRKIGITSVDTLVNGSSEEPINGRMVWPRQGFDFASDETGRTFGRRFAEHLGYEYGKDAPEYKAWQAVLKARGARPHSWDIAAFKDGEGARVGLEWMGRKGDSYTGIRTLDPESLSDKVWKNFQGRELQRAEGIKHTRVKTKSAFDFERQRNRGEQEAEAHDPDATFRRAYDGQEADDRAAEKRAAARRVAGRRAARAGGPEPAESEGARAYRAEKERIRAGVRASHERPLSGYTDSTRRQIKGIKAEIARLNALNPAEAPLASYALERQRERLREIREEADQEERLSGRAASRQSLETLRQQNERYDETLAAAKKQAEKRAAKREAARQQKQHRRWTPRIERVESAGQIAGGAGAYYQIASGGRILGSYRQKADAQRALQRLTVNQRRIRRARAIARARTRAMQDALQKEFRFK